PAEVVDDLRQPSGPAFGVQGPDQGYALKLANNHFRGKLFLAEREHEDDVIAGCVAIALRRASLYGRAPVIHDLRLAFTIWGFLDENPDPELVELRRHLFEELSNPHHYFELRRLANGIREETLRLTPDQAQARRTEWRALLGC